MLPSPVTQIRLWYLTSSVWKRRTSKSEPFRAVPVQLTLARAVPLVPR